MRKKENEIERELGREQERRPESGNLCSESHESHLCLSLSCPLSFIPSSHLSIAWLLPILVHFFPFPNFSYLFLNPSNSLFFLLTFFMKWRGLCFMEHFLIFARSVVGSRVTQLDNYYLDYPASRIP